VSIDRKRPAVVAFDGLHRTGKGTQAEKLQSAISRGHMKSVVVRGDGTRNGLGLHAGDPYSEEWQARGRRLKSPEGNTVEGWNAASYILARELTDIVNNNPDSKDFIIVDRTLLSRAAFLLHRGIHLRGDRLTLDEMYAESEGLSQEEKIDFSAIVPNIIFDLQVDDPRELLNRLDEDDPKYQFRSRNIKGGFDAARVAASHIPEDIEERVVRLDALEGIDTLHQRVMSHLGRIGLIAQQLSSLSEHD